MKEKFAISIISQLSSNILQLFAFYLLFLNLDVATLGIWAFLTSIINLGFLFVNIGLDSIHYQYSGKKESSENFGTFFLIKIVLILINVVITFILMLCLQLWGGIFFIMLLFLLIDKIIIQISQIFLVNLKTKIKIFKAELPSFFITLAKSLSIIYLLFNLSHFSEPLLYLCISNFIFDSIFIILILFLSKNDFKINKPKKDLAIKYIIDVKPLLMYSVLTVIAANLGHLILDYSFGHETLGYVSLVSAYIMPILFIISGSMVSVYLTLFSKYFEKGDMYSIKRLIQKIEKFSSIIFLSIILIVLLNGELIISIILPKYMNSVPILYIMIFIPYFIGISQPHANTFIAGKKQNVNAFINSLTRIFIILLMIFLIPTSFMFFQTLGLGALGYALSQTIPWIFWCLMCRYYSYKNFQIESNKNLLLHVVIAIFSLLIGFISKILFQNSILNDQIFLLIFSSLIVIGTFIGSLFYFKELKREDIKFLLQIIKPQSYITSLKEEF